MRLVTLKTNCTDDSAKRIKTASHTLRSVPVSDCEYDEFQYLKESQRLEAPSVGRLRGYDHDIPSLCVDDIYPMHCQFVRAPAAYLENILMCSFIRKSFIKTASSA